MSETATEAGNQMPTKKQKLSSDENSNPDLSGDENVSEHHFQMFVLGCWTHCWCTSSPNAEPQKFQAAG